MTTLLEKLKSKLAFDTAKFEEAAAVKDPNSEDREYLEFLRGEWNESARLKSVHEALVEIVAILKKDYPCAVHDMEPNTTMDYFRCDKCGLRPVLEDALSALAKAVDE